MRPNSDIDDGLMAEGHESGRLQDQKETVEPGLKLLARKKVYEEELRSLRGTIAWEGDLDEMRTSRFIDR